MEPQRRIAPALNDPDRLAALDATSLLDEERVKSFDLLARTAARADRAPVAQVNLLTADRQVPVACFGPEPWASGGPVSLDYSFCQHVVASGEPLVVEDAREHPLTRESAATTESGIVSYASVPLTTREGLTLGSLCVVDFRPRAWTEEEVEVLRDLAALATLEIEDRLRAERRRRSAVRESETKFRLLVEAVREYGIFMLDPQGRVMSWNPGAERISGYSEAEILGRHFSAFYTEADRARGHPAEELRIARERGHYGEEGWRVRKDGSRFWASVTITAVRDDDGQLFGFGKVTRDLTERKAAEEELITAKEAAEEASRAKSDFLATMSHELRTPLNAIIGYTDLLVSGVPEPIPEKARQQVERIGASARHLLGLIEEILLFSRIEAGRESVAPEEVELRGLMEEVAAMIEPLAAKKGLAFRVEHPAEPVVLRTDAGKAKQILLNLLGNAVKFTREGEVTLSARVQDQEITVEVRDTGIGIASEHLERVFEPFFQAEAAKHRRSDGTGLGLGVARHLAQILGGTITVDSTIDQGSCFRVQLPKEVPGGAT